MAKKTKNGKAKNGRGRAARDGYPKAARAVKPRPRQADLPGTEDRAIKPLEDAAATYADIRDQRMELNQQESQLKQSLIRLMKRYGKTHYKRDGVEIDLVTEAETVRVRVKKQSDGDGDPDLPPGEAGDVDDLGNDEPADLGEGDVAE